MMFLLMFIVPLIIGVLCRSFNIGAFLMIVTVIYAAVADENRFENHCSTKMVKAIGGCGRYGKCRVEFADGSDGMVDYPLVGHEEQACTTVKHPIWFDR